MRIWFSGPRIFGLRTGVSFGREDLRAFRSATSKPRGVDKPAGSFVYVVSGAGHCKIGVSTNPLARLATLQTAAHAPLEFSFVGVTPGDGYDIEREAHAILTAQRTSGEWFDVSPELATAAVMGAAARISQKLHPVAPSQVGQIIAIASSHTPQRNPSYLVTIAGVIVVLAILAKIEAQSGPDAATVAYCVNGLLAAAISWLFLRLYFKG